MGVKMIFLPFSKMVVPLILSFFIWGSFKKNKSFRGLWCIVSKNMINCLVLLFLK